VCVCVCVCVFLCVLVILYSGSVAKEGKQCYLYMSQEVCGMFDLCRKANDMLVPGSKYLHAHMRLLCADSKTVGGVFVWVQICVCMCTDL